MDVLPMTQPRAEAPYIIPIVSIVSIFFSIILIKPYIIPTPNFIYTRHKTYQLASD